jgi:ABC-type microcin C transport system permease subunit YejB
VTYAERVSGAPAATITQFFATGMLMNVLASFDAMGEDWGIRLIEACKEDL